ncbi:metallophosphoesterase [Candidatus Bathyarchaeota archaeon]|nr:metallophosphoesterase [Candidatus Bathyarchaeota archaeon]
MVIPLVKQSDGTYRVNFLGLDRVIKSEKELDDMEKSIRLTGFYPHRTSDEELSKISDDEEKIDTLFTRLMIETLNKWFTIAEHRLEEVGVKCYITPGNDDKLEIDQCFRNLKYIINPEGQIINIDAHHEMISTGYSNITPFKAPRELPEEELSQKIEAMVLKVQNISSCIFNLHCPPLNSGLDACQKLDVTLKPVFKSGHPVMIGGGSSAVRRLIEKYQPLISLHGHIHESKNFAKIGRTLCYNPGSEYSEGILNGVIINLTEKGVKSHQFTSG